MNPIDAVRAAWRSADPAGELNRAVERLGTAGVSRDSLDDALGRLADEVEAAGADEGRLEVIRAVGDRLHGWCHPSRRIDPAVRPAADAAA